MSTNEAVLLITGAWHVPEHYRKVTSPLEASSIRVLCPTLPTNNGVLPPNKTLADDINFIRDIVTKEIEQGTKLTVLAHSYGGVVATGALEDLGVQETPKSGDDAGAGKGNVTRGGVTNIIFMAAFLPFESQSLAGIFGGELPPFLIHDTATSTLVWDDPIGHMYHDLSSSEAQSAEALRVPHSYAAQYTPLNDVAVVADKRAAAWRTIPVSYLVCEDDRALPNFLQRMMVEKVRGEGVKVEEYSVEAGHSPFLSKPERVVEVVMEVMGR